MRSRKPIRSLVEVCVVLASIWLAWTPLGSACAAEAEDTATAASAPEEQVLNTDDNAWLLTCSALVLMMTANKISKSAGGAGIW